MFKKFSLVLAVSFAVMSFGVNASAKQAATSSSAVLDTNFNNKSLSGWNLELQDNASAEVKVKNKQLAVKVLDGADCRWDIELSHPIEPLEVGAEYIVQFQVRSSKQATIYAKIGDDGDPFREFWSNNYVPFSITSKKQTVCQQFRVNKSGVAEEFAFHLGGEFVGEVPYVVYFDNIKITKVESTNVEPTNELINYNFSDNLIGDWKLNVGESANAVAYVSDNKLNVQINENGESNWDIALTHKIGALEMGAKYRVEFKVSSIKDTKVYAKIGDVGDPFAEHWNNIWAPITIPANTDVTISQEFIMNQYSDNDEIAFHMGGNLAGDLTNVISFDDISITKI